MKIIFLFLEIKTQQLEKLCVNLGEDFFLCHRLSQKIVESMTHLFFSSH